MAIKPVAEPICLSHTQTLNKKTTATVAIIALIFIAIGFAAIHALYNPSSGLEFLQALDLTGGASFIGLGCLIGLYFAHRLLKDTPLIEDAFPESLSSLENENPSFPVKEIIDNCAIYQWDQSGSTDSVFTIMHRFQTNEAYPNKQSFVNAHGSPQIDGISYSVNTAIKTSKFSLFCSENSFTQEVRRKFEHRATYKIDHLEITNPCHEDLKWILRLLNRQDCLATISEEFQVKILELGKAKPSARLLAIGLDPNPSEDGFLDPLHFTLMDNPVLPILKLMEDLKDLKKRFGENRLGNFETFQGLARDFQKLLIISKDYAIVPKEQVMSSETFKDLANSLKMLEDIAKKMAPEKTINLETFEELAKKTEILSPFSCRELSRQSPKPDYKLKLQILDYVAQQEKNTKISPPKRSWCCW